VPNALTDTAIRTAKPPERGTTMLWDGSLKNFGVRISQGGTKTFIVLIASGRRQSIGRYPTLSLSQARTEAKRLLAEKALGKVRPIGVPFDDAKAKFLAQCEEENKPRTVQDYRRILKRHFPYGRKAVADINAHELHRRLDKIAAPAERRYAYVVGRIFFNWCVRKRYLDRSPLEHMEVPANGKSRARILSDDELKAVWNAATEHPFGHIVRLLILTGQRRGEIAVLQREWVDEKEQTITLPREITKNSHEHTFPYGDMAAALLAAIPNTGAYLFPAARNHVKGKPTTCFNGWSKAKADFDESCSIEPWTLHDLRRTFSSGQAALGTPLHITERILNHISGTVSGVAAIYNRYQFLPEMREAMDKWEAKVTSLIEPSREAG
jgi:integrase